MRTSFLALLALSSPLTHADDALWLERVTVIHEHQGEATGDIYGWIARNLGDVDGDAIDDYSTSAPFKTIDGVAQTGKIYTYSGRTGQLLWEAQGKPGAFLGVGIGEAGDVNSDGIPDVVVGAPGARETYVYSGDDGRVLLTLEQPIEHVFFGRKVMGVGDVNDDGHDDLLLGSPGVQPQQDATHEFHPGAAFLYSGKDGQLLATLTGEEPGDNFGQSVAGGMIDGVPHLLVGAGNAGPGDRGTMYIYTFEGGRATLREAIVGDEKDVNFGWMFTSLVGDIDGDGAQDIYTTDWNSARAGTGAGRIAIYSGRTLEILHDIDGQDAGENFGIGTCETGDLDGDGCDDFAIGAWQNSDGAENAGKVYVYSGKSGELLNTITSTVAGETFGFDVTDLGDVDGDGTLDLLITSGYSPANGQRSGRVWVVSSGVSNPHK
ncbi:MAG: integrin alpha [Phycisphaerales bacterium JB043]